MQATNNYSILTTDEAAGMIGLSVYRIRRLIHRGQLKAKKYGGCWIMPATSVRAVARRLRVAMN